MTIEEDGRTLVLTLAPGDAEPDPFVWLGMYMRAGRPVDMCLVRRPHAEAGWSRGLRGLHGGTWWARQGQLDGGLTKDEADAEVRRLRAERRRRRAAKIPRRA